MKDMHILERDVNGRRYRIAAQSVWGPVRGRSVARQTILRLQSPAVGAHAAYLALLEPAIAALPSDTAHLVIIPHGDLHSMPFPALWS